VGVAASLTAIAYGGLQLLWSLSLVSSIAASKGMKKMMRRKMGNVIRRIVVERNVRQGK
jgi:hypothetical protein